MTLSFYETMVIDTPEAGANLAKAIEDYEKYGPYIPGPVQRVSEDPEDLKRFMGALSSVEVVSSIHEDAE